jgi:hypothetical protein
MPGLVEVTPLRLKYLDAVLSAYASQNGGAHMPVDVWTVHIYILPEGVAWGAHYPVGITPTAQTPAMAYAINMHDNQTIFQQQVRDMRNWMSQNGYRDTPLIFTEFGILYPSDYRDEYGNDFSAPRVNAFMNGVFDFFRTATDANTGYPADGNRLVQAWAWYSTADTAFNGRLFDPATGALTSIGQNYSNYTRARGPDLLVSKLPQQAAFSPGGPVTATLTAYVYNRGYTAFGGTYTLTFYSNISYTQAIGSIVVQGLPSQATQTVQATWPSLSPGLYPFYTRLDTSGGESNACNNVNSSILLVAIHQVFLPGLSKSQ